MNPERAIRPLRASLVTVVLLSAGITGLQLALMRLLSFTRWHHFSFLVISTALLGYGMSGTLLWFTGKWMLARYRSACFGLSLAMALTGALCLPLAEQIPIDSQYTLRSASQVGWLFAYNGLILVPFLLGATVVGLVLMAHPKRTGTVYAGSLLGTAAGGLLAVLGMSVLSETALVQVGSLSAVAGAAFWLTGGRAWGKVLRIGLWCPVTVAVVWAVLFPSDAEPDPYKGLATMQRWEAQGDAERLHTEHGPRGRIDVYASPLLHQTLFAGLNARRAPPSQLAILRDGHFVAPVFAIASADDAEILDHVPSALAYRLFEAPRALIVGDVGGVNVWLARRHGARAITVVQHDPRIPELLNGPLAEASGRVFTGPDLELVVAEPRLFLEATSDRFDVVQLAFAEESAAESSGLQTLREDFVLTREGLRAAFECLSPDGVLSVTRGIQAPPRDGLKLIATLRDALEAGGVEPSAHLAVFRNYLAVTVLIFRTPPDPVQWEAVLQSAQQTGVELVLGPDIEVVADGDLARYAEQLLGPGVGEFEERYIYDLRGATDDRPYFFDFFRFASLDRLPEIYGERWYQHTELGFAIVVLVLAEVLAVALLFIILPLVPTLLARLRGKGETVSLPGLAWTALYFGFIGYAFMVIETLSISRFILLLGNPAFTASTVICALLLGAGLGSLKAEKSVNPGAALRVATTGVLLVGVAHLVALSGPVVGLLAPSALLLRVLVVAALCGGAGYFMGFFFPTGLALARGRAPGLVPWAWSVNGFASVATPPLAMVLVLGVGFKLVIASALLAYVGALVCAPRLGSGAGP